MKEMKWNKFNRHSKENGSYENDLMRIQHFNL